MGVFFTKHILERLAQRGIPQKAIESILQNFEKKYKKKGKICFEGLYKNKKIIIITQERKQHLVLITAYYS